jgi:hypothetical protein
VPTDKDVITLIKDENRRRFTVEDVQDQDVDIFYTEFVVRLRELRDQGVIDELAELRDRMNRVVLVDIVGGIDLNRL